MLCRCTFPTDRLPTGLTKPLLPALPEKAKTYPSRIFSLTKDILNVEKVTNQEIVRGGYDRVLFASYKEYLAPLWAP